MRGISEGLAGKFSPKLSDARSVKIEWTEVAADNEEAKQHTLLQCSNKQINACLHSEISAIHPTIVW
jgi:hypothetical protein